MDSRFDPNDSPQIRISYGLMLIMRRKLRLVIVIAILIRVQIFQVAKAALNREVINARLSKRATKDQTLDPPRLSWKTQRVVLSTKYKEYGGVGITSFSILRLVIQTPPYSLYSVDSTTLCVFHDLTDAVAAPMSDPYK
ncbi:unnamed protein product [Sphagnum jensenii]|jgi:hypothetical protein|uniref:Uncharacterized protein n=1 Tax=Sphagnum jensenii TaxID=128206 RepID=A0ABP0WG67_9BRYO